jgi:hypothetical protein
MNTTVAMQKLEILSIEFEAWRKKKTFRTEPIPKHLVEKAVSLFPTLKSEVIGKRLGTKWHSLSRRFNSLALKSKKSSQQENKFVDLTPFIAASGAGLQTFSNKISIKTPDGLQIEWECPVDSLSYVNQFCMNIINQSHWRKK